MRPTPIRLPDDLLAPLCRAMGLDAPEHLNEATRAAAQAQLRSQIAGRPQRRAGRFTRPHTIPGQTAFGFDESFVDLKKRAANDGD